MKLPLLKSATNYGDCQAAKTPTTIVAKGSQQNEKSKILTLRNKLILCDSLLCLCFCV